MDDHLDKGQQASSAYEAPKLKVLGSIAELTQGNAKQVGGPDLGQYCS